MAAFAERLKEAMELKGLKQADVIRLAQPFGEPVGIRIGKSHMSQYVSGKTEPRRDILKVLAQALEHVFNVDNRIVNQRTDGDGHAADAHRVDGEAHELQDDDGDEQRERDGGQGDERRAAVHEEDEEHEHHEDAAFNERFADV